MKKNVVCMVSSNVLDCYAKKIVVNPTVSIILRKSWRRHAWPSGRALDLYSGGPGFRSSSLPLDGFVFGGPEFNSSTPCKYQTGGRLTSWWEADQLGFLPCYV